MPDKTAGQWIGTIVGAALAIYTGNPIFLTLGYAAGSLVDPPKGPSVTGPRLDDLAVQGFQFGNPLGRDYGKIAHTGTVIWVENNALKEVVREEEQGGKGGGSTSTVTTYSYFSTFAVALEDAPPEGVQGVGRIWVGPDLIFNALSDDLETVIASQNMIGTAFMIYYGTDDQMPDPRIEAEMGVGNTPAYRGTAYIVFYDYPLAKLGNTLMGAQVKVELITSLGSPVVSLLQRDVISADMAGEHYPDNIPHFANFRTGQRVRIYVPQWDNSYPSSTLRVFESNTTTVRRVATLSFEETFAPVPGLSDVIAEWNPDAPAAITSPTYSNNVWRTRNGYRYWLDSITDSIYTGISGVESLPSDAICLDVAQDGTVWVMCDGYIVRFESDLTLIDQTAISFSGESYGSMGDQQCSVVNNKLVVFFDAGLGHNLYIVGEDLTIESGPYFLPFDGAYTPSAVSYPSLHVDSGIIIRVAFSSTGEIYIDRFKMPAAASEFVPLSDIVEQELLRAELIELEDINVSELSDDYVSGYTIAGIQQIRSCLRPLMVAWPFDLIMDGYQIKAVRRGKSSIATIPVEHMDAREYGAEPGIVFERSREMDSQLPRKVIVRYLDADREYDANEQASIERQSTSSVNIQEFDIALVFSADEAAQVADVVQTVAWLQRSSAKFKLPPTYLDLQPADVITVEADYGTFELMLVEVNYTSDGGMECSALPNSAASYTSVAVGGIGTVPDGSVPLQGESTSLLIDMPLIRNVDNIPRFAATMAGSTASWSGGLLFKSIDSGQSWQDIQAWNLPGTFGIAIDPLPSHDCFVIDRINQLQIEMFAGTLSSITEAQMMTGQNWAAYGIDGRWELIRFADADLQPDGTYIISTILRGLRGSDWASGLHEAGDYFVLLDDPQTVPIAMDSAEIGINRQWRSVSVGQAIDEVESVDFVYRGVNLKPLSPVYAASSHSIQDWEFTWRPRTRLQGTLWNTGVALPMGETTEQYQVDIFDGSTVVRTLTTTIPSVIYTAAQQIEDFGGVQNEVSVAIYQMSSVVGRGYPAYLTDEVDVGNRVLLLHFDGANGSTTIVDSSGYARTITPNGDAKLSTAQLKFGTASLILDGTGDFITAPNSSDFQFGTGDFTIEGWVRLSAYPGPGTDGCIVSLWVPGGNLSWHFGVNTSGYLTFYYSTNGTSGNFGAVTSGTVGTSGAFTHVAATREGGRLRLFVNGAMQHDSANTANFYNSASPLSIGGHSGPADIMPACYFDEIMITKGIGKYTADFTPPSAPF